MKVFLLALFISLNFFACKSKKLNEIIVGHNIKAIGKIASDTTYDGLIKFYNTETNSLLYYSNYKNGILEGESVDYYENGKLHSRQNYTNGLLNGPEYLYDKNDSLFSIQNFYYGLQVGSQIDFKSGDLKEYTFYSFDSEVLLYLNYDSLKKKKSITDVDENFFFFHSKNYHFIDDNVTKVNKEYFIYLISPPRLKFEYSLVKIDSSYHILHTEKILKSKNFWTTFTITDYKPSIYALKLFIKDSINNDEVTMFKKI